MSFKNSLTLYISGRMTDMPGHNHPAFHDAQAQLEAAGYTVLNPANNEPTDGSGTREHYMTLDINMVLVSDGIALLDGWIYSQGVHSEIRVAQERNLMIGPVSQWIAFGQMYQQRELYGIAARAGMGAIISKLDTARVQEAITAYDAAVCGVDGSFASEPEPPENNVYASFLSFK